MTDSLTKEDLDFLKELQAFNVQMTPDEEAEDEHATDVVVAIALEDRDTQIAQEFPTFAWLDQEGLLPDGLGDDLRADLKAMAVVLPGLSSGNAKRVAMMDAYRRGDMAMYDKLYAEVAGADPKQ